MSDVAHEQFRPEPSLDPELLHVEIILESCTESRELKVRENNDWLAKHVVFDDSEKFEISRFGTTFQNSL